MAEAKSSKTCWIQGDSTQFHIAKKEFMHAVIYMQCLTHDAYIKINDKNTVRMPNFGYATKELDRFMKCINS